MNGSESSTAAYWTIYIYFMNRVYRELQRAVRTSNVKLYVEVLPYLIDMFFALNRPNYARWRSLFLYKFQSLNSAAHSILESGAFSIRRTKKPYSRTPMDLTLEQTVNRDAASPMRGISALTL